jgi:hypothetical protein
MSLEAELDKGHSGAKRSSWKKIHFRDLALKVCEENPEAGIEELADAFLVQLKRYPDYMESIAVYIMANIKASLEPGRSRRPRKEIGDAVLRGVAGKVAARVLMTLPMPSGKTLGQSTGRECTQAGGWLVNVGERVGPAGIVSEHISEKQLAKMFRDAGR